MTLPRNFLFVTFEGGGNVPPVLGLARRLLERGHHVRVLTEPCLQPAVEAIGAAFVPFTEQFTRTDRNEILIRDWEQSSPPAALKSTMERVIYGPAESVAHATEAALDAEAADVVVADWMMPGALVAAEARRLPSAALLHCIDMRPGPGKPTAAFPPATGPLGKLRDRIFAGLMTRLADGFLPNFNDVRTRRGLPPLEHALGAYDHADRVLVQSCEAFDFPMTPPPANLRYVGPVLDEPDWLDAEAWNSPWAPDDARPLVVVSLSTTFQNQRQVLEQAIAALGKLEVRGLVTLGPAMHGETIAAPANVRVVESAPHGQIFPHAAAFVTHCGHGSVMRALAHGLPLVALPMGRDQDAIATRIVTRGLGLEPKREPAAIAAALRRVLAEPSFREAAQRLGAEVRHDAAADRGVLELESLAAPAPLSAAVA